MYLDSDGCLTIALANLGFYVCLLRRVHKLVFQKSSFNLLIAFSCNHLLLVPLQHLFRHLVFVNFCPIKDFDAGFVPFEQIRLFHSFYHITVLFTSSLSHGILVQVLVLTIEKQLKIKNLYLLVKLGI